MKAAADAAIERFLDALWLEDGLSRNTLSAYRSDLEGLSAWLRSPLTGATREQLQAYLAECVARGARPRTTGRLLSSLRRFYQHQLREGAIAADPTALLDAPRLGRPLPKATVTTSPCCGPEPAATPAAPADGAAPAQFCWLCWTWVCQPPPLGGGVCHPDVWGCG